MKKDDKKLRYGCHACDWRFSSWQARDRHARIAHKPPVVTEKRFIRVGEPYRLINGEDLKLGSKVIFEKSGVITKITLTEKSSVAEVEVSVISDSWRRDI